MLWLCWRWNSSELFKQDVAGRMKPNKKCITNINYSDTNEMRKALLQPLQRQYVQISTQAYCTPLTVTVAYCAQNPDDQIHVKMWSKQPAWHTAYHNIMCSTWAFISSVTNEQSSFWFIILSERQIFRHFSTFIWIKKEQIINTLNLFSIFI